MRQAGTTFAEVASARGTTTLKRPNCLKFKTKNNLKRTEVLETIINIGYDKKKILGIAEMKGRGIDVTCTSRKNVLELYEKLENVSTFFNLHLYDSENLKVALGWVPIPMTNDEVKEEIEKKFGKVYEINHKKHKDGLLSGIRILTMNKKDLDKNPIPSYIKISNYELYVTYSGQKSTCRYCGETGHIQLNCRKRLEDFPTLPTLPRTEPPKQNLEQEAITVKENVPIDLVITGKKRGLEFDENEGTNHNLKNQKCEWFKETISLTCLNCNNNIDVPLNESNFSCWCCSEEFDVVKPCCSASNEWERFLQPKNSQNCKCPKCHSIMNKLPCCSAYQLDNQPDSDITACESCDKLNIVCDCKTINCIPPTAQSRNCSKVTCPYKIIHCNCGICDTFLFKGSDKYHCECGYEFEGDIDIAVLVT